MDGPSRRGTNVTQVTNDRRDAGDVGRRIDERQDELNLSIAQVAERAGMATVYFAATDLRPAELGVCQSTITTLRPIVARDSIAPTISGSAENEEVEPAIGRIVSAAIILKRSSWSRTPTAHGSTRTS